MTLSGMAQLCAATAIFVLAGGVAKSWTLAPGPWRLVLVIALYSAGNLVMLRLIREMGMGVAISLAAVAQMVAINLLALAWFGEKVGPVQGIGIAMAVVSIALITLGPWLDAR